MSKLDEFKKFVSNHPEFIDYVKNNSASWQNLYELYDLYGEKEDVWKKYIKKESISIEGLLNTVRNINLDSLEENINSIQKAVSLVEELTKKSDKEEKEVIKNTKIDTLYNDNE